MEGSRSGENRGIDTDKLYSIFLTTLLAFLLPFLLPPPYQFQLLSWPSVHKTDVPKVLKMIMTFQRSPFIQGLIKWEGRGGGGGGGGSKH